MTTSDSDKDLRPAVLLGVVLMFDLVLTIFSNVKTRAQHFGREKEIRGLGDGAGLTLLVIILELRAFKVSFQ